MCKNDKGLDIIGNSTNCYIFVIFFCKPYNTAMATHEIAGIIRYINASGFFAFNFKNLLVQEILVKAGQH